MIASNAMTCGITGLLKSILRPVMEMTSR